MHVLVLGGTRFVGHLLVWRLIARGDRVTVLNRGITPDSLPAEVERLRADRADGAGFAAALAGRTFDAVVDFNAYGEADARSAADALRGHAGHLVMVSTGQVYLVRTTRPAPAREEDYAGPVMERPEDPADASEWDYGVGKRAAEELFAASGIPTTILRIPMVNGERDYYRRIEGYLWRMLDGGPVLLPDGGKETCRHVYGRDVARAIADLLGKPRTFGGAWNLANDEVTTTRELLSMLADRAGTPERFVEVPANTIAAAGIKVKEISPFSQQWMSHLEPAKAKTDLGWRPTPLGSGLDSIVAAFVAYPPTTKPDGYRHREVERTLAK